MKQMNRSKWTCAIWEGRKVCRKEIFFWLWFFRNPIPAMIRKVKEHPHITPDDMEAWMDGWVDGNFDEDCNPADAELIISSIIKEARKLA